jgi:hypothetical protein
MRERATFQYAYTPFAFIGAKQVYLLIGIPTFTWGQNADTHRTTTGVQLGKWRRWLCFGGYRLHNPASSLELQQAPFIYLTCELPR